LKSDPLYNFDVKIVQSKRPTLEKELAKVEAEYAAYDPAVTGYKVDAEDARAPAQAQLPEKGTQSFAKIKSIKPLQWYEWADPRWKTAIKSIAYGSSKEKSGEEQSGTGPGEKRLAQIFGGKMQGGGVSFDVVTPDGLRWEVKALDTKSALIRPGTEGLAAYEQPKQHLDRVMKQLKNFTAVVAKAGLEDYATPEEIKAFNYISSFVEGEYEMIVGKGEISGERVKTLRAVLRVTQALKSGWESQGAEDDIDTTVGLANKEVEVDKNTYIDVAKKVQKAVPSANVLDGLEQRELALATLKDHAFDDPGAFLDEWYDSIDVNRVFEQVDGVFIVSQTGFNMVPKSFFKRAFKFKKVSQGKPKFEFVYYTSSED